MKVLSLFILHFFVASTMLHAQDPELLKKKRKDDDPVPNRILLDTIPKRYLKINADSLFQKPNIEPGEMPIVKLGGQYTYQMPLKWLSGKGSVAMPGTELLDKKQPVILRKKLPE